MVILSDFTISNRKVLNKFEQLLQGFDRAKL